MAQRAQSVEPAFATLKRRMHGGRFLLRGKAKATTETKLAAIAFDFKHVASIHGPQTLIRAFARRTSRSRQSQPTAQLTSANQWILTRFASLPGHIRSFGLVAAPEAHEFPAFRCWPIGFKTRSLLQPVPAQRQVEQVGQDLCPPALMERFAAGAP